MRADRLLNAVPSPRTGDGFGPTVGAMARTRTPGRAPAIPAFGKYLADLMKAQGLNNTTLGEAAGVDNSTISRLRRGVDAPSSATLEKLAPHLGVRHGDLVVAAGLGTKSGLGMAGSPPPAGPPLHLVLRSLAAEAARIRATDGPEEEETFMRVLQRAAELYREMRPARREPNMGAGRSRPTRRS